MRDWAKEYVEALKREADLRRRLARALKVQRFAQHLIHEMAGHAGKYWSKALIEERTELRARRAKGRKS